MKQRLLSLLSVAALSVAAMAQTWTAPVAPESPAKGVDYVTDGTSSYYLYNVGCGQFVTGANSWATQISLGTEGKPYMELVVEPMDESEAETYPDCVKLKLNGTFYFTGGNNRTDYAVSSTYLFRDSEASGFIDHNNQACWYWKFTKAESGNYYWQSAYNAETGEWMAYKDAVNSTIEQYAAGKSAGAAIVFDATIEDSNIEWAFVPAGSVSADDMKAFSDLMAIYQARLALYNLLLEGAQYGVDTEAATAVYEFDGATVDELKAATTSLSAAVTRAAVLALIPQSSEDNPLDITKYTIVNPDFENGQAPWTITEGMGNNLQVQATAYENNGVTVKNWIESWLPQPGTLRDGVICQTVTGLPEGRYRIECDAIAVQQSGAIDIMDQTGVFLFYNNGSYTVHSEEPVSTGDGLPEHFSFDFDYSGAETMTIGLMADNTNCNWMGMDNFRLYAIGECKDSPSWTALVVTYNAVSPYAEDVKAETALVNTLKDALADAEPLVSAASDKSREAEYVAALNAIDAARKAVFESEAAYKKLDAFIDQLTADDEKYEGELQLQIEALMGQYEEAYQDGTMTAEEIEAAIAAYEPMIKDAIKKAFDEAVAAGQPLAEPLDITSLFDHMSFAYGTTQTAFADGYPAANEETGVVPVWMNESKTGNFKTNYSTAEVWDARPFNIFREFQNLPKGRYTIQTNAFFRVEANDTNYPNWQNDPEYGNGMAYLYAGANRKSFVNLAALACPEFVDLTSPYDCADGNYLPNNQQSAYLIFTDARFAEQAEKTIVSVSGNVLNDGDVLRVGVAGTDELQGNHWTIWYGFKLFYNGAVSGDALNEDIQALIDKAAETNDHGVAEGARLLADALEAGEAAIENNDTDVKTEAINKLSAAIAYAEKSGDLIVNQLMELVNTYNTKLSNLEGTPTDETIRTIIEEADASILNEAFESNAQIEGWINGLKENWFTCVLSMDILSEASIEAPVDLSALIENAGFDSNNKDGWTVEQEGNAGGDGDGCAEFWGATSFDIYQVLPTLRDGYYRLSVDALYRFGGTASECAAVAKGTAYSPEMLYVNTNAVRVKLWSDIDGGAYTAKAPLTQEEIDNGQEDEYAPVDGCARYTVTPEEGDPWYFWSVNNKSGFQNMIADGRYHNEILFSYGVENGFTGEVRIGLKKNEKPSNDNDWCPFDNFKLEYLGATAPDAVESIAADGRMAAIDAIYTIDGRRTNALRRGINIVRNANGQVTKVLVK